MKKAVLTLARKAIRHYLKTKEALVVPADLPKTLLKQQAGVFVSLHHRTDHSLRGCIGTFLPVRGNLAEEIILNAIAAANKDPRFEPVSLEELSQLEISVDLLSSPRTVAKNWEAPQPFPPQLNPKKYGLIVSSPDGRKGLLLPDLPGVKTTQEQIKICRQKGGIATWERVKLEVFTVTRYQ
ncbi:AmmeMemoRadiSam system protein A [Patescibacteria group bacterium]